MSVVGLDESCARCEAKMRSIPPQMKVTCSTHPRIVLPSSIGMVVIGVLTMLFEDEHAGSYVVVAWGWCTSKGSSSACFGGICLFVPI